MSVNSRSGAFALVLFSLLASPSLAVEPDVDLPGGFELPVPADRPNFPFDNQTGAPGEREIEGTDILGMAPEVIVSDDEVPVIPPPAGPEP
jgi:hypothetical protein